MPTACVGCVGGRTIGLDIACCAFGLIRIGNIGPCANSANFAGSEKAAILPATLAATFGTAAAKPATPDAAVVTAPTVD